MSRIILVIIAGLLCLNLNSQNLESHSWINRIIIVKSKDAQLDKYQKQLVEFRNSMEELRDRKLVLYQIVGSKYRLNDYENLYQEESEDLSSDLAKEILNEKNEFEVILIGLDGGIKLRRTELLTKEELFGIIDSMPMRKAELRNRGGKKR